jgi:hypothetical protein
MRVHLLLELANVEIGSKRVQKILATFEPETATTIRGAQQSLREIWDRSVPLTRKQEVVDVWLAPATKRAGRAGLNALLPRGRLEFDPQSFPGQFVMAILEHWWKFQICANPDCPARYFLAKRKTQIVCEEGQCLRYTQRKRQLEYWHSKGKLRQQKGAVQ